MIPLRDAIRSKTIPYVNYSLIFICLAVFLFELSLPSGETEIFIALFAAHFDQIHEAFFRGSFSVQSLSPLFTYMFLHGGWAHLIGNMLYLYVFGDNVEDRIGHIRYLGFYFLSGIGAALVEAAFQGPSPIPLIGASGAIAGVLGAYFLLFPRAKILTLIPLIVYFPVVEIRAVYFLGLWLLSQFLMGSFQEDSGLGGVAWWAHAGGFVIGAVLLPFFVLTRKRR